MQYTKENRGGFDHASLRKGFTLVEILITLAIAGILTLIVTGVFSRTTSFKTLEKETAIVLSLLDQARNQTLSAKNALVYGVHFETTKAVLFVGPTYSSIATSNVVELLSPLVQISAITLAGGGSDVVFKPLTGETPQTGTITLSLVASSTPSKIVTVFATGVVQSN